jgi:hypothetical protein
MQTAKQLSVSSLNKPGRLAAVLTALGKEKQSLRALAMMDSGERGTLRFVPEDPASAMRVLESINIRCDVTEVLMVELPSQPGGFRKACERLAGEHLAIDYAYCSAGQGKSVVAVIKVNDLAKAQRVLSEAGQNGARRKVRRSVQARDHSVMHPEMGGGVVEGFKSLYKIGRAHV